MKVRISSNQIYQIDTISSHSRSDGLSAAINKGYELLKKKDPKFALFCANQEQFKGKSPEERAKRIKAGKIRAKNRIFNENKW